MIDFDRFEREGFAVTPSLLSASDIAQLISLVEPHVAQGAKRGGVRDVMDRVPELRSVADKPEVRTIVDRILGCNAFVVRSTLFDKTDGANWKVPWHQDVTIAVAERVESEGFSPWSIKGDVVHVQPPSKVLEAMVTVRVHLDACPATNGALRVMPKTHRLGRIHQSDAPLHVNEEESVICAVAAGEALVMRPLLLHASSPSLTPSHRRVLHFDYAVGALPNGLRWAFVS